MPVRVVWSAFTPLPQLPVGPVPIWVRAGSGGIPGRVLPARGRGAGRVEGHMDRALAVLAFAAGNLLAADHYWRVGDAVCHPRELLHQRRQLPDHGLEVVRDAAVAMLFQPAQLDGLVVL
eukprot:2487322-Rhodomonas_salina.1